MADQRGTRPPADEDAAPNPGDVARPGTPGTGEGICPTCRGTGLKDRRPCPDCGGTGIVIQGIAGG